MLNSVLFFVVPGILLFLGVPIFLALFITAIAILLDFFPTNLTATPMRCSPALGVIANDPDTFGVLDLPRRGGPDVVPVLSEGEPDRLQAVTDQLTAARNDLRDRAVDAYVGQDRDQLTTLLVGVKTQRQLDAALTILPDARLGSRARQQNADLERSTLCTREVARRGGEPLLPAAIVGAFESWPRTSRWPGPGQIRVCFGRPIPAEEIAGYDARELVAEVHRRRG